MSLNRMTRTKDQQTFHWLRSLQVLSRCFRQGLGDRGTFPLTSRRFASVRGFMEGEMRSREDACAEKI